MCEAQLQDTLGLQHLLIAQLHNLLIEGGVGQDPYQVEDGEALTEALEQHTAKQPAQDVGMAPKDVGSVEAAALRTSLAASRVELAHAFRWVYRPMRAPCIKLHTKFTCASTSHQVAGGGGGAA